MKQTIQLHLLIDVFFVLMLETEMNSKCISTLRLVRYSEIVVSLFLVTMELILRNEQMIYKRIALWSRLFSRNSDTRLKGHISPGNKDR